MIFSLLLDFECAHGLLMESFRMRAVFFEASQIVKLQIRKSPARRRLLLRRRFLMRGDRAGLKWMVFVLDGPGIALHILVRVSLRGPFRRSAHF
jgi:hypothetical protein